MRLLLLALLAAALASPADAQHAGHGTPAADPHASHAMPPPAPPQPPRQSPPEPDPHAGHAAPEAVADPHEGHRAGDSAALPPAGPPPAEALAGPAHGADLTWDPAEMARARGAMRREHGGMTASRLLVERLEVRLGEEGEGYGWDAEAWWGGDIDKLWLKSEGEGEFGGRLGRAEVQALWSRAIDPWFDLQLGLRRDFGRGPGRSHLVAGVQGVAPYWIEVDAALFLSDEGEVGARFEAEYDLRVTQRLILQPRGEIAVALQDIPELAAGAGITEAKAGLRLRYEVRPEFAPYIGVHHERAFGGTARYRRAAGDPVGGWALVLGVRAWF